MPATTHDQRRRFLTRTDLGRLGVPAQRVEDWLATGGLEEVGELPVDGATEAVFAAHAVPVRDELRQLLAANHEADVALEPVTVRAQLLRVLLELRGMDPLPHTAPIEPAATGDALGGAVPARDSLSATLASVNAAVQDVLEVTGRRDDDGVGSGADLPEPAVVAPARRVPAPAMRQAAGGLEFAPDATEVLELLARDEAATPRNWRSGPDPEALVESLQKIHVALLSLAERRPVDPIAAAVEHGLAGLREALLSHVAEIAAASRAVTSPTRPAVAAPVVASPAGTETKPARRGRSILLVPVVALVALGSVGALWLYTGDSRTAMLALVAANVIACAAIAWRRS